MTVNTYGPGDLLCDQQLQVKVKQSQELVAAGDVSVFSILQKSFQQIMQVPISSLIQ